jgi:tRNA A58 N-methylase Trm61
MFAPHSTRHEIEQSNRFLGVEYNSVIVLYGGRDNIHIVKLESGGIHDSKHGHFHHDDIVKRSFGDKVRKTASFTPYTI